MKIFYSAGSQITETTLDRPNVMLSYYTVVKKGKPSSRLKAIMSMVKKRKAAKRADKSGRTTQES